MIGDGRIESKIIFNMLGVDFRKNNIMILIYDFIGFSVN